MLAITGRNDVGLSMDSVQRQRRHKQEIISYEVLVRGNDVNKWMGLKKVTSARYEYPNSYYYTPLYVS